MDPNRFDELTKRLSPARTRRSFVQRGIGVIGGLLASLGLARDAGACHGWSSVCLDICCNETCVDTDTNRNHCGWCENRCPDNLKCVGGRCRCDYYEEDCDGVCVSLDTTANCGSCGNRCEGGKICNDLIGDCICLNYGRVDLDSDSEHCGYCENACPDGTSCINGVCDGPRTEGSGFPPGGANELSGARRSTYRSPTWGYELSWAGTAWRDDPARGATALDLPAIGISDLDGLWLTSGTEALWIEGFLGDAGNPESCLNRYVQMNALHPNNGGFGAATDGLGNPISGTYGDGIAYGVYAYTDASLPAGSEASQRFIFLECRTLVPGHADLATGFDAAQNAYSQTIGSALGVLDSIRLAPAPGLGQTAPGSPGGFVETLPLGAACTHTLQCDQQGGPVACVSNQIPGDGATNCCREAGGKCARGAHCCGDLLCTSGVCL